MKPAKIFITFTFLLAFAGCVSAQEQMPKIVWKNLQEKYERFEDIKPTILNANDKPIYIFTDTRLGVIYDYLELYRFFENSKKWFFVIQGGHPVNKKYQESIMSSLKIESRQEIPITLDDEDWLILTESDGTSPYGFRDNPDYRGKGKYKLTLKFYTGDKKRKEMFISESPAFEIIKEQTTFFNK